MNIRNLLSTIQDGEIAQSLEGEEISLDSSMGFAIVYKKSDVSLTNKTFTTVSLNAFTVSSHGYKTGLKVRFATSGALPTGLALATDYYLIVVSSNTLMVASSQQNASDGDYLSISAGSGTHTISVQTASTPYLRLKGTIDGILWVNVPNGLLSIDDTAQMIEHEAAYFHKVRADLVIEAGQYNVNCKIMVKSFK